MREDKAELGEVPPIVRVLVEHLLLALLEQFDGLLAFPHQIIDEDVEVLVGMEQVHLVLVLGIDQPQPLIRIRQNVQDEGGTVLEVHLRLLTQLDHLVHQLPRLLEGLLIGGQALGDTGLRDGSVQLGKQRRENLLLRSSRRHLFCSAAALPAPLLLFCFLSASAPVLLVALVFGFPLCFTTFNPCNERILGRVLNVLALVAICNTRFP